MFSEVAQEQPVFDGNLPANALWFVAQLLQTLKRVLLKDRCSWGPSAEGGSLEKEAKYHHIELQWKQVQIDGHMGVSLAFNLLCMCFGCARRLGTFVNQSCQFTGEGACYQALKTYLCLKKV